jgi:hypothetical protein
MHEAEPNREQGEPMRVRNGLMKGIVHVSFPGGGLFLPARTPYDRQTLVEHVKDRARVKGQVQVLVSDHRWIVRFNEEAGEVVCCACGHASESACSSSANGDGVYCVTCAFGDHSPAHAAASAA